MTSTLERHCAPQNQQLGCQVHQTLLVDLYLEHKSPPLAVPIESPPSGGAPGGGPPGPGPPVSGLPGGGPPGGSPPGSGPLGGGPPGGGLPIVDEVNRVINRYNSCKKGILSALLALENTVRTSCSITKDSVSIMRDEENKVEVTLDTKLNPILQELWQIDVVRGQLCQTDFEETSEILHRRLMDFRFQVTEKAKSGEESPVTRTTPEDPKPYLGSSHLPPRPYQV